MKVLLLLVAVLIASALAQGHLRPQLSNSFSAVVDFQERHGHTSRSFSGNWYMDDIGRQERFNAQSKRGLLDFFRFWNTSLAFGRPKLIFIFSLKTNQFFLVHKTSSRSVPSSLFRVPAKVRRVHQEHSASSFYTLGLPFRRFPASTTLCLVGFTSLTRTEPASRLVAPRPATPGRLYPPVSECPFSPPTFSGASTTKSSRCSLISVSTRPERSPSGLR